MTVTLRPATDDDLMAVGALHQRSRVAAYSSFLPAEALADPTPEAMGRYWVERWLWERDDHRLMVAERDGTLVGFSYLGPDDEDDPATGLLNAIHLDPGEQGRGTGRAADGGRPGRHAGPGLAAGRALGAPGATPTPAPSTSAAAGPRRVTSGTRRSAQRRPASSATPAPLTHCHPQPSGRSWTCGGRSEGASPVLHTTTTP